MLRVTGDYEQSAYHCSYAVFNIETHSEAELQDFLNKHKEQLKDTRKVEGENNGNTIYGVQLKITEREIAEALVRRYNMVINVQNVEENKRHFLEEAGIDAVKVIVYATDYVPEEMDIEQYCASIFAAYDTFGDSPEFINRVYELSGDCNRFTHEQHGRIHQQIELLRQLLFSSEEL
jgi:hypothetical protein